jgi:hypothetical protein
MNLRSLTYTLMRGGLFTLIVHIKYSYPSNFITKIPIHAQIAPYLQILNIQNLPLKPWLLLHLYMPSHIEDLLLMPDIQTSIIQYISLNLHHNILLYDNFNHDIVLIGRQHNNIP